MNFTAWKKAMISLALVAAFVITAGAAGSSSLFAQNRRWRDRVEDNRWERREERKGYNDGLDRGREDARARRSFDPNHSSHFRNGNREYREGFRRGYAEGYRQYERRGRW